MTTILLGIDGTGPFLDKEYFADLNASFVAYILRHSKAKLKKYIRGPWSEGFDMASIVSTGYTFVHLGLAANKGARILLTGYSRGGSGVIGVAQRLKTEGVKVHGMVLFDAVDRAVGVDTAVIPLTSSALSMPGEIPVATVASVLETVERSGITRPDAS